MYLINSSISPTVNCPKPAVFKHRWSAKTKIIVAYRIINFMEHKTDWHHIVLFPINPVFIILVFVNHIWASINNVDYSPIGFPSFYIILWYFQNEIPEIPDHGFTFEAQSDGRVVYLASWFLYQLTTHFTLSAV